MAKRCSDSCPAKCSKCKKKADIVFSFAVRLLNPRCQVCGAGGTHHKVTGGFIDGLHCHHLIGRGRIRYRFDLDNGMTLCPSHHKFNTSCSPHHDGPSSVGFHKWLESHERWLWFEDNREDHTRVNLCYWDEFKRLDAIVKELKQ